MCKRKWLAGTSHYGILIGDRPDYVFAKIVIRVRKQEIQQREGAGTRWRRLLAVLPTQGWLSMEVENNSYI